MNKTGRRLSRESIDYILSIASPVGHFTRFDGHDNHSGYHHAPNGESGSLRRIKVFDPYQIGFSVRPVENGPVFTTSKKPYLSIPLDDERGNLFRASLAELMEQLPFVEILNGSCKGFEFARSFSPVGSRHFSELRLYGESA